MRRRMGDGRGVGATEEGVRYRGGLGHRGARVRPGDREALADPDDVGVRHAVRAGERADRDAEPCGDGGQGVAAPDDIGAGGHRSRGSGAARARGAGR